MYNQLTLVLFIIASGLSSPLAAQIPGLTPTKNWDLNGYVKYAYTASAPDNLPNQQEHTIQQRFNYEYRFNPLLTFNLSMRNQVIYSNWLLDSQTQEIEHDQGYWNLTRNIVENSELVINSQLDRLNVSWQHEKWLIKLGRFRVNWAMNTIWNPNDIFNTYSIYELDYAERAGTDAILISRQLAFASSLEFVYSPQRQFNSDNVQSNQYAARYLANYHGWDVQTIVGKTGLDNFIGAGIAGNLASAGLRAEVTWFSPNKSKNQQLNLEHNLVASIETDYSLPGEYNWLVKAAIIYIKKPQPNATSPYDAWQPLNAKTLSFSQFTHYFEVSLALTPLNRTSLTYSYYQNDAYYVSLANTYSLANEWQLLIALQRFSGFKGNSRAHTANSLLRASLQWNF